MEGVVSICISVALTFFLHETSSEKFSGDALDWVLLSFAVITPISAIINMSFNRRERALVELASFRASCISLYQSHAMWGWNWKDDVFGRPNPMQHAGKAASSREHSDEVMRSLLVSLARGGDTRFVHVGCPVWYKLTNSTLSPLQIESVHIRGSILDPSQLYTRAP